VFVVLSILVVSEIIKTCQTDVSIACINAIKNKQSILIFTVA